MTCKFCSGHIEHDDGWIDEYGDRVPLHGGLACKDESYATVEFSHDDECYTGTLWAHIHIEAIDGHVPVVVGTTKVGEYRIPSEYSELHEMWCLYIDYCPFCGEKLSARLDGGAA